MKLCFYDIETTGLDWDTGHKIIEVACSLYESDDHRHIGDFVRRINRERAIDPAAQAVHGIAFEELSLEDKWISIAPKLHKLFAGVDVVVAHNGNGFDLPFTAHQFKAVGLDMPRCFHHAIDTMVQGRWATPLGKTPNLGELCVAAGVSYDPDKAHSALYDVNVMAQAFFAALDWGHFTLSW